MVLALKLLVGLVIIAAPGLAANSFIPGASSAAFFGVLAATFGWISGGPKAGAAVVASLTALGVIAILLRDQTWVLALLLLLLGVGYGYAASKGYGTAFLQLPILTPYFINNPPDLFSDPPVFDLKYFVAMVSVMLGIGLWAILVLKFAGGTRKFKRAEVKNSRQPLLYGSILGVFSAVIMVVATTSEFKTHWVWITLTLYVLADPQRLFTPAKMGGRVLGTLLGFVIVSVLIQIGVPNAVLSVLAILALWLCVLFMTIKKPYWQYALFLTISVILMDSSGVPPFLLNMERIGFTFVGALLSILVAFLINMISYSRPGLSAPVAK